MVWTAWNDIRWYRPWGYPTYSNMVLFPSLLHHLLILQRWHLPKRLNDLRLRYLQLGMVEKHTLSAKIEGGLSWRKKSKNAPEVEVDVTMLFFLHPFLKSNPPCPIWLNPCHFRCSFVWSSCWMIKAQFGAWVNDLLLRTNWYHIVAFVAKHIHLYYIYTMYIYICRYNDMYIYILYIYIHIHTIYIHTIYILYIYYIHKYTIYIHTIYTYYIYIYILYIYILYIYIHTIYTIHIYIYI